MRPKVIIHNHLPARRVTDVDTVVQELTEFAKNAYDDPRVRVVKTSSDDTMFPNSYVLASKGKKYFLGKTVSSAKSALSREAFSILWQRM